MTLALCKPVFSARLPDEFDHDVLHAADVAGFELRVWPKADPKPENVVRMLVRYGAGRDEIEAVANKLIAAALERRP